MNLYLYLCIVSLDQDMAYAAYRVQLAVTSVQYTPALTDPASTQAQDLADSLTRAVSTHSSWLIQ